MVETREQTHDGLSIHSVLGLIKRSMPSFETTKSAPVASNQLTEAWLTRSTSQGASKQTARLVDFHPSPEERAYYILTFLIEAYAYLGSIRTRTSDTSTIYKDSKTLILNSLRQAMATRTQPHWTSPFAILASYKKPDGTHWIESDALGQSAGSAAVTEWYEELRSRLKVGEAVDTVARWIERDVGLLPDGGLDQVVIRSGFDIQRELVGKVKADDLSQRRRGRANAVQLKWKM